jgi:adenylate cyclase
LTDTSTRRELWAQNYDIVAGDLFRLQDELVQQIVVATSAQVTRTELERIRRKPTTDLTAYDLFLKGRDLRWRYDRESNVASRKLLEQAVEADPRFAEARVELGRSWLTGSNLAWDGPEALEQARDQAAQAIALDGTLSSAHALLARTLIRWRQFDEAIQSARRAVELNSSDAESLQLVAEVLTFAGQPGEALTLINRAMLLNPHYPPIYAMVAGRAALMAGDLTQAASLLRQCATRAPSIWPCRAFLAVALERSGKHQEARLDVNEYLRIAPGTTAGKLQQRLSFRNDVDVLIILDALKSAGLPE